MFTRNKIIFCLLVICLLLFGGVFVVEAASLQPPVNIKAVQDNNVVVITWQAPKLKDYDGFRIYRSEKKNRRGNKLTFVKKGVTKYVDAGIFSNKTYYYTVRTFKKKNKESTNWKQISVKIIKFNASAITAPSVPNQQSQIVLPVQSATATATTTFSENLVSAPVINSANTTTCFNMNGFTTTKDVVTGLFRFTSSCFPTYRGIKYDGYFLEDGRPAQMLPKTCGSFNLAVVFFNTNNNRELLKQNPNLSQETKTLITTDARGALERAFIDFTADDIIKGFASDMFVRPPLSFNFDIKIIPDENSQTENTLSMAEEFRKYDATIFIEDLSGTIVGQGIRRWPMTHPIFNTSKPLILQMDPVAFSPGLLHNELFRRALPTLPYEYIIGEQKNPTQSPPIINPRTGQEISIRDQTKLSFLMRGWSDIDKDGIVDCVDPSITPNTDNVDGDLYPDTLDPDINKSHTPYHAPAR